MLDKKILTNLSKFSPSFRDTPIDTKIVSNAINGIGTVFRYKADTSPVVKITYGPKC